MAYKRWFGNTYVSRFYFAPSAEWMPPLLQGFESNEVVHERLAWSYSELLDQFREFREQHEHAAPKDAKGKPKREFLTAEVFASRGAYLVDDVVGPRIGTLVTGPRGGAHFVELEERS